MNAERLGVILRFQRYLQAQNGATALHNAAGGGFDPVVKALLAASADIDVQNTNCNTALHLAAGKGSARCHFPMQPRSQHALLRFSPLDTNV